MPKKTLAEHVPFQIKRQVPPLACFLRHSPAPFDPQVPTPPICPRPYSRISQKEWYPEGTHISSCLVCLLDLGASWRRLLGQSIVELGRLLDGMVDQSEGDISPIEAAKTRSTQHVDEDLAHRICMGEDVAEGEQVINAGAHASSQLRLASRKRSVSSGGGAP